MDEDKTRLLSTWNQVAPRSYIRVWQCFPFRPDASLEALEQHLRRALHRLSKRFPDLTGRILHLSEPIGCLGLRREAAEGAIPLEILDQRETFGWTYAELKAQGFPAKAFVNKGFDLPYPLLAGGPGVPVFEVHGRVIEGGLLLCIYMHHAISDGAGMNSHVRSFAELTRDPDRILDVKGPADFHIEPTPKGCREPVAATRYLEELARPCPEYAILGYPGGPTQFCVRRPGIPPEQIKKTGRVFAIDLHKIDQARERLAAANRCSRLPSTFICLAAVTWAHAAKARLLSPTKFLLELQDRPGFLDKSHLTVAIDWRRRAFTTVMGSSAGNAIVLPLTTVDTKTLLDVCGSDKGVAWEALGEVVRAIEISLAGIDDDFIAARTSLFRAAPDPRLLGLSTDVRDPYCFYINTWRHFGADTRWSLPGLVEGDDGADGVAPDAIRRAQAEWNMGAGLILPGRKHSTISEMLVTLDVDSMELLLQDTNWKGWIDHVLE